ncbi:MAG: MarR family transcriptional regulator [Clostridia bacterium]|nr:MarR family transcriptional regulator [Clostridia bacterium]
MNNSDSLDKQKFVFSRLFLLSNKLQTIGDQVLDDEITIRQWLLTVAITQFGDTPPTLGEAAELMGSSHQNIKQLALNLQRRGFLNIERDRSDLRAARLVLTEKICSLWERRQFQIKDFLTQIFKDLSIEEIDLLYDALNKLYESILKMKKEL